MLMMSTLEISQSQQNETSFGQGAVSVEGAASPGSDDDRSGTESHESPSEVAQDEGKDQRKCIDEVVREDMNKLDESFPGISQRFRLVNRIGEGKSWRNVEDERFVC